MGGGCIFWYMSHRSNELKGFIWASHNLGSKDHSTSTSTFTPGNQKADIEPPCFLISVVATRVCNNSLIVLLLRLSRKDWLWIVVMTSGIQEALLSLSVSYHLTNAQVGTLKNSKVMWTFSANKEYWIVGWHWPMAVSHQPQRVEKNSVWSHGICLSTPSLPIALPLLWMSLSLSINSSHPPIEPFFPSAFRI